MRNIENMSAVQFCLLQMFNDQGNNSLHRSFHAKLIQFFAVISLLHDRFQFQHRTKCCCQRSQSAASSEEIKILRDQERFMMFRSIFQPFHDFFCRCTCISHLNRLFYHITVRTTKGFTVKNGDFFIIVNRLLCPTGTLICTGKTICHSNIDNIVFGICLIYIHYFTNGWLRRTWMVTFCNFAIKHIHIYDQVSVIQISNANTKGQDIKSHFFAFLRCIKG